MVSVNGKIPAGSISFNASERFLSDHKLPLEKCPDKSASVYFTQNY
jgi:hypothetical protein